jgi:rSAM/selenodomain-associated transferase 1
MQNILGIFAKFPRPGEVKTRLASATSPEFAAQVADACLRDTLDRLDQMAAERWLAYEPASAADAMAAIARARYQLAPQGDGDLGQRLERYLQQRLRAGSERVVVIGADSPTLPLEYIDQAFAALTDADVVLGPATDGGYYLLGCTGRVPAIFHGITWSQATVLRDTISRLDPRSRLALVPPWYDVDTLDDWRLLQGHVAALRKSGRDPGVPRTEHLFAAWS